LKPLNGVNVSIELITIGLSNDCGIETS